MATLIPKYDQDGAGAVNRPFNQKLAESISVKDFGATGDGTTDDTAAINAAITYAISQAVVVNPISPTSLVTVIFPSGKYVVSSTISLSNNTSYCNLEGQGAAELYFTGTGTCLSIGNNTSYGILGTTIKNLKIQKAGAKAGTGLVVQLAGYSNYEGLSIDGFDIGVLNQGSINCTYDFKQRGISNCNYGFIVENILPSSGIRFASNLLTIKNLRFNTISNTAFTQREGAGIANPGTGGAVLVEKCTFEGISGTGSRSIYLVNTGEIRGQDSTVFRQCWFEGYGETLCYLDYARATFENCFIANGGATGFVLADNASYLKLDTVVTYFIDAQPTGNYLVSFVSPATAASLSNLTVVNCNFEGLKQLTSTYPDAQSGNPSNLYPLNLPTPKVYRIRYNAYYPVGNNAQNWGLVVDLKAEVTKLNGTNWNYADVIFNGFDGVDKGFTSLRVFFDGTGSLSNFGNNVAYTVSGVSITFVNDGTGRWFNMDGTYTVY
jgi:hypothetical protein